MTLWRLRCSFHRTLNYPGIRIVHIWTKQEVPELSFPLNSNWYFPGISFELCEVSNSTGLFALETRFLIFIQTMQFQASLNCMGMPAFCWPVQICSVVKTIFRVFRQCCFAERPQDRRHYHCLCSFTPWPGRPGRWQEPLLKSHSTLMTIPDLRMCRAVSVMSSQVCSWKLRNLVCTKRDQVTFWQKWVVAASHLTSSQNIQSSLLYSNPFFQLTTSNWAKFWTENVLGKSWKRTGLRNRSICITRAPLYFLCW